VKYALAVIIVLAATLKVYTAPASKSDNMTVIYWKEYTP
jgi:hypothetical protein